MGSDGAKKTRPTGHEHDPYTPGEGHKTLEFFKKGNVVISKIYQIRNRQSIIHPFELFNQSICHQAFPSFVRGGNDRFILLPGCIS